MYRPEIDGLRAIAVVPVILFHAGLVEFSGGYVGVDVFFVISGYLITRLILNEIKAETFSVIRFYKRRARRILPAILFMSVVCVPFAMVILLPQDMVGFGESLIALVTFSSNFFFWTETGYFAPISELAPLLHTWSLAVEEQFYILFPVFMVIAWKLPKRFVIAILAAILVGSLFFSQWAAYNLPDLAFYLLPTRVWEIICGVLVAIYMDHDNTRSFPKLLCETAAFLGLLLIIYSFVTFNYDTPTPSLYTLVPITGTALIILFATEATFTNKMLSHKSLVGIGLISYSAYLWHQPIFAFTKYIYRTEYNVFIILLLILIIFALAYGSWRFIETPFRRGITVSDKRMVAIVMLTLFLLLTFGVMTIKEEGFSQRYREIYKGEIGHDAFFRYLDQNFSECVDIDLLNGALQYKGHVRCNSSYTGEKDKKVVIIGDSQAEQLIIGISDIFMDHHVVHYTRIGVPFAGEPMMSNAYNYTDKYSSDVDYVIIAASWEEKLEGMSEASIESDLRSTVSKLPGSASILLLDQIPEFKNDIQYCKYLAIDCRNSIEGGRDYAESFYNIASAYDNVTYIDPRIAFENEGYFSMVYDNIILYRDRWHLNVLGSRFVGGFIHDHFN